MSLGTWWCHHVCYQEGNVSSNKWLIKLANSCHLCVLLFSLAVTLIYWQVHRSMRRSSTFWGLFLQQSTCPRQPRIAWKLQFDFSFFHFSNFQLFEKIQFTFKLQLSCGFRFRQREDLAFVRRQRLQKSPESETCRAHRAESSKAFSWNLCFLNDLSQFSRHLWRERVARGSGAVSVLSLLLFLFVVSDPRFGTRASPNTHSRFFYGRTSKGKIKTCSSPFLQLLLFLALLLLWLLLIRIFSAGSCGLEARREDFRHVLNFLFFNLALNLLISPQCLRAKFEITACRIAAKTASQ